MPSAATMTSASSNPSAARPRSSSTFFFKAELDAQSARAVLKNLQQPLSRDARKAVTARRDDAASHVNIDVVPVREARRDRVVGVAIGGVKIPECLVGKDDAPSEGVVGFVSLKDRDPRVRLGLLEQQRQVQAGRPAANHRDFHRSKEYANGARAPELNDHLGGRGGPWRNRFLHGTPWISIVIPGSSWRDYCRLSRP